MSLITVFGLGHVRPAPGTWGSMPPVLLAAALIAAGFGPDEHPAIYHAALAAVLLVCSWACLAQGDEAEARFGRKDPSEVVADETAGQCIPLMLLPAGALATTASAAFTLVFAFVCFRVMDILKPAPAHGLQRIPGGLGILADDLVAGIYALLIVQAAARLSLA